MSSSIPPGAILCSRTSILISMTSPFIRKIEPFIVPTHIDAASPVFTEVFFRPGPVFGAEAVFRFLLRGPINGQEERGGNHPLKSKKKDVEDDVLDAVALFLFLSCLSGGGWSLVGGNEAFLLAGSHPFLEDFHV